MLLADLGLRIHPDATPSITGEGCRDAAIMGGDSYAAGKLALVSYALQQTWRNRAGRRLTLAGYRATGGIDGAVAQAAENVYTRLGPSAQVTLQRMLLRMVTLERGPRTPACGSTSPNSPTPKTPRGPPIPGRCYQT